MRGFKAALATSIGCATAFPAMPVLGQSATDGANVTVDGKFANVKTKDKPTGISGMACLPPSGEPATRQCLTVNDEENFAEIATLAGDVLKPTGRMVQLIGKAGEYPVSGVEATAKCDGAKARYGEFDGEGVSISGGYVYVTGSHSCSGQPGEAAGKKLSSFVLARYRHAANALDIDPKSIQRTWRVSDVLRAAKSIAAAYGMPKGEGTNIEGLAVAGGRAFFGLRTPVTNGLATIVSANADDLFADGPAPLASAVDFAEIPLGDNAGVRDLAALDDAELLILSGPARSEPVPYKLWYVKLGAADATGRRAVAKQQELATITSPVPGRLKDGSSEPAKAETIVVLDPAGNPAPVLVLYDNINDGGPRRHSIVLPK